MEENDLVLNFALQRISSQFTYHFTLGVSAWGVQEGQREENLVLFDFI
jgi:hypothetical protein